MGYILFFSTVLDYYFDANGVKKRLKELYDFTITWDNTSTIDTNFEYVIDNDNGSILLMKKDTTATPIGVSYRGKIVIKGQYSQKSKTITFNY